MTQNVRDELLEAFRAERAPPPGRAEANWSALQASLATLPPPAAQAGATASGGATLSVAGKVLLTLAVGVVGALLWHNATPDDDSKLAAAEPSAALVERAEIPTNALDAVDEPPASEPAPETPEPAAAQPVVAPPPTKDADADADAKTAAKAEAVAEAEAKAEPKAAPKPRHKPKPKEPPSLTDEIELIASAQASLAKGDARGALSKTRAHQRKFAGGRLVDERKLLRMQALCALGKRDAARSERDAFLQKKPNVALSSRVRKVCP